jgi:tRNA(Ile)-lysidine synthase
MARHRLLAEAARGEGAEVILFAHTADDAAENALMRQVDAPTLGSLREWSPSPAWPEGRGVFALRPLLGVRRGALREFLRHKGLNWLDDPANDDIRYARPRARQALADALTTAVQPSPPDPQIKALAKTVISTPDGQLILPRSAFGAAPRPVRQPVLAMAAICASGQPSPPRGDTLDRLADRIEAGRTFVTALAGARITLDADAIVFSREPGDMARNGLEPQPVGAGRSSVWDGRFDITADSDLIVAPLSGSAARLSKPDRASLAKIPAEIRAALPALFQGEAVSLPRPFGAGPANARPLAAVRFGAAAGLIEHERDISPFAIAQPRQSSYVEALALA